MARILLVDDDEDVLSLLEATLAFGPHEVVMACDAESALDAFVRAPADVVVLDLGLPGTTGQELLARLRRAGSRCRVIVVTGSGPSLEQALRTAGADAYLTKPFGPLELLACVERAIHAAPATAEVAR